MHVENTNISASSFPTNGISKSSSAQIDQLSVVKAGYRFSGAAAPCSGVQGMYKLPAAAFAQCILLPTLQNVGVKLLATF